MHDYVRFAGVAAAAALAAFGSSAAAQDNTTVWSCQDVGIGPPESLGDREGHSVSVSESSCRAESGPLAGVVNTGTGIWEWNGPNAVLLIGGGVNREPGLNVVWKLTEGKIALTMTDGKVTGWTASGRGVHVLAVGSRASLAGKPYSWKAKSVGPASQFSVETTPE
jgi:hypothetical protein